jgi:hypothetical protein
VQRHLVCNPVLGAAIAGFAASSLYAQPCEPYWSDEFTPTPLNEWVWDLAVFDDGSGGGPKVYAAGLFESAGETIVNHVARLDGNTWSPIGAGVTKAAYALAASEAGSPLGRALFVAGHFETAGHVEAANVARWNGKQWSALGAGVTGDPTSWAYALRIFDEGSGDGPALYVGGFFDTAGAVPARSIARWDGESWSALGSGLDGAVGTA